MVSSSGPTSTDRLPGAAPHPATRPHVLDGELQLSGRLLTASNASFVGTVGSPDGDVEVIYKPTRGERELWDFPTDTLGLREVAAYRISAAGGFDVVPYTAVVDGPFGPGSAQVWVDTDTEGDELVDVVSPDAIPEGWFPVLHGEDEHAEIVVVVHADDVRLRRLAVFDALINNADRKAGHILLQHGRVLGCDHGVSFHDEDKLRTLLWGWAGEPLSGSESELVRRATAGVDELADLLADEEIEALLSRAATLLAEGLPRPRPGGPAVPWPLW